MSVIEDTRKVMQDFLAPELRGITARLDALEKRFDGFEKRVDARFERVDKQFEEVERRADKRHEQVMTAIHQVVDWSSVQERLARLESKEHPNQ